jgi:small subunit ribosomal protein S20
MTMANDKAAAPAKAGEPAAKKKLVKGRHKSAMKRARQAPARAARNATWRSQAKTIEKKVLAAIQKKDVNEAKKALVIFMSTIDKAAQKGAVHVRRAARRISSLSRQIAHLHP